MKTHENNPLPVSEPSDVTELHGFSCRKLFSRLAAAKDEILAEFRERLEPHEELLHRALGEAEALAWQTPFPHLVFPELAFEKAQAVAAWSTHQRSVQRVSRANLRLLRRA